MKKREMKTYISVSWGSLIPLARDLGRQRIGGGFGKKRRFANIILSTGHPLANRRFFAIPQKTTAIPDETEGRLARREMAK
jgi:hypothetical protein